MTSLAKFASLVKFEHTVFALPFAYVGMLLASRSEGSWPDLQLLALITLAMAGARTCAMALNRLIDHAIDARNPRTAVRELPAGVLRRSQVWLLALGSGAVLVGTTFALDPITRVLWPIPVTLFVLYPFTKRFTWACHIVLGCSLGLAPVGAWLAVTGTLSAGVVLIAMAIALWVAGFDVIYATQDVEFDRSEQLHSIPVAWGISPALTVVRLAHAGTVALLAAAGFTLDLGPVYLVTVGVVAAVLAWENSIVRPTDLSRVNAAFFTANGVVGIVYAAGTVADQLI